MADGKKSFILYADLIYTLEYLSDEDAGKVFKWVLNYVNDKEPEPLDGLLQAVAEPIRVQLKRDLGKWDSIKDGRSKAGKASAEARRLLKEQNLTNPTSVKSVEQSPTNPTVSDSVSVSVNVSDIKKKETSTPFDFRESLLDQGASSQLVDDWLKVRKDLKASDTETALKKFITQVCKSGKSLNDILELCCEKSWKGFNASWIKETNNLPNHIRPDRRPEDNLTF